MLMFLLIAVTLFLIVQQNKMRRRISDLERHLAMLSQRLGPAAAAQLPDAPPEMLTDPLIVAGAEPPPADKQSRRAEPEVLPALIRLGRKASARAQQQAPAHADPALQGPIVLRTDRIEALFSWLCEHWVYVVSAISLALAGVFFVQYGIENGLLPPALRVVAGVGFGLALIGGGEWLRRRFGDEEISPAQYLPSVFSGAGLVAIFAAVAAGRMMYMLYSPAVAFAGLLITAAATVLLGWRHGPLMASVGLIGAAVTPFLVGAEAAAAGWLYGYYLLIAAVGLAIDAWRHWAWVSVLALVLAHFGLATMMAAGAGHAGWLVALTVLAALAILLPERRLLPAHAGPSVSHAIWQLKAGQGARQWPDFPVRLAAGNLLAVVLQFLPNLPSNDLSLLPFFLLAGMAVVLLMADEAPGLEDLAVLPTAAFVLKLLTDLPLIGDWHLGAAALRALETSPAPTLSILLGLVLLIAAGAAWRSLREGSLAPALGTVALPTLAVIIFDRWWQPVPVLGAFGWALHVIAVAGAMVLLAAMFARRRWQRRSAWATLSALFLIALALFVLTATAALTLALSVLLVVAVALDRRFALPEMGWFVQLGAAVLAYRLVVDPGMAWARFADLGAVLAAYLGVVAACVGARRIMPNDRTLPKAALDTLGLCAAALLANVLLLRGLDGATQMRLVTGWNLSETHWGATLHALPWLLVCAAQLWRAGVSRGFPRLLYFAIGAAAALPAGFGLAMATTAYHPLLAFPGDPLGLVLGPPLLDSLALAYALPGALLVLLAGRMPALPDRANHAILGAGLALLTLYAVTEIRRLWHGPFIGSRQIIQGELYSYTLALLLTGAVLLWLALSRRSMLLRRVAMAVIGLTVAKVFLWDASGLSGLVRVVSFAGLGLSLAALAWLNRWAQQAMRADADGPKAEG